MHITLRTYFFNPQNDKNLQEIGLETDGRNFTVSFNYQIVMGNQHKKQQI